MLEVRPPVRIDKGAGISSFLDGVEVDVALYVGDDATDLDAFRALAQLVEDGPSASARSASGSARRRAHPRSPSEADIVVDGTDGVRELLAMLVADVDACGSPTSCARPC